MVSFKTSKLKSPILKTPKLRRLWFGVLQNILVKITYIQNAKIKKIEKIIIPKLGKVALVGRKDSKDGSSYGG